LKEILDVNKHEHLMMLLKKILLCCAHYFYFYEFIHKCIKHKPTILQHYNENSVLVFTIIKLNTALHIKVQLNKKQAVLV
jgi:hypothetical protein